MKLILLLASFALASAAQTQTHSVTLIWTDTANPTTGTSYNVYRLAGACPATAPTVSALGGFALLNSAPLTTKTYMDTSVTGGTTYCYGVTAVSGTSQSAFSPTLPAAVPTLFAPLLSITIAQ